MINASAFILIGGMSRRFGSPKWKTKVNNVRMIDHLWGCCQDFNSRQIIGKNQPEGVSYPFLQDEIDLQSPVIGLLTALNHTKTDWNFIISCDLPLMTSETIQHIWAYGDRDADTIVPLVGDHMQPTCAFYHKRNINQVRSMVNKDELRVQNILEKLQTSYVVMDKFEKEFTNMNKPKDLKDIIL